MASLCFLCVPCSTTEISFVVLKCGCNFLSCLFKNPNKSRQFALASFSEIQMASDDNVRLLDIQPFRVGAAASFHCKADLICQTVFFSLPEKTVGVGLAWRLRLNQKMEER